MALEGQSLDIYARVADSLNVSIETAIIIIVLVSIWTIIWKGFALWKSVKKTKLIWFIAILVTSVLGLFSMAYLFIFSKIKDSKNWKKIHDATLALSVILGIVAIWYLNALIPVIFLMILFSVSMLQETFENKEWWWLVLGIIPVLTPFVTVIYYFAKGRNKLFSDSALPGEKHANHARHKKRK